MMLYLTPAALSYLTELILAALISGYLLIALRRALRQPTLLLTGFFLALSGLIVALFFEAALPPSQRIYAVYGQNPLLAVALICLLQFAYHFPVLASVRRRKARLALSLSGLYTLWECGYAVYRLVQLDAGRVFYRSAWSDYALLVLFLWLPVGFLRQLYLLAPVTGAGWRGWLGPILRPPNRAARALHAFALIFLFVAGLNLFTILRDTYLLSTSLASIGVSLGILLALFLFAVSYLNAQPETTSFVIKLGGVTLTVMLAALGSVGWVIAPPEAARNPISLPDHHTLRFTPNQAGGYDIAAAPFSFERTLGQNLQLTDRLPHDCSPPLPFVFPFYGRTYQQIYACNDGTVSLGQAVQYRDYQYRYGAGAPLIMALLLDLDPTTSAGGVFARQERDRLVVTWSHMRGFEHPELEFTFQAILHRSGVFELSYNGLPRQLTYAPNDNPGASVWAVGAVPGALHGAGPQRLRLSDVPVATGPAGALQDYLLDYRQQRDALLTPLAWLILATSAFIVTIFPLQFYLNLVSPLNALLRGVQQMEAGDYTIALPVRYRDEIGFLTRAFNQMSAEQGNLIQTLESRVAERTAALNAVNSQLRAEIVEREEAQALALQHQRTLAALAERERLGRELHDSLGQLFGFINVQAQAAQVLLRNGDHAAAQHTFAQVGDAARQAHTDVRGFILGLRAAAAQGFWAALQHSVADFNHDAAVEVTIQTAEPWDEGWLSPIGELNLLRIVQEALINARRHAQATQVWITVERAGDQLHLTVRDNGRGFRPEREPPEADHFGLMTMHERAEALYGTLTIRSDAAWGSEVRVACPIQLPTAVPSPLAEPLRVVLVDDHPMFLAGLRNLLVAHGMQVVGMGSDGAEAQDLARTLRPDLIVMDLQMPRCDGLEATRRITADWPEARIVILTVAADEGLLFEALKAGAAGYLLKNMQADDFFLLLAGLEQGAPPIAPELAVKIDLELTRHAAESVARDAAITPLDREILGLIGRGMTYHEVAHHVHMSEASIKYHMKHILASLHLANRAQAVAYAHRSGLVADK